MSHESSFHKVDNNEIFDEETPQAVMLVVVRESEGGAEILLGQRPDGRGGMEIWPVGGKVEPGESLVMAVKREAYEEAGITEAHLAESDFSDVFELRLFDRRDREYKTRVFIARFFKGEEPQDIRSTEKNPEFISFEWIKLNKAKDLLSFAASFAKQTDPRKQSLVSCLEALGAVEKLVTTSPLRRRRAA